MSTQNALRIAREAERQKAERMLSKKHKDGLIELNTKATVDPRGVTKEESKDIEREINKVRMNEPNYMNVNDVKEYQTGVKPNYVKVSTIENMYPVGNAPEGQNKNPKFYNYDYKSEGRATPLGSPPNPERPDLGAPPIPLDSPPDPGTDPGIPPIPLGNPPIPLDNPPVLESPNYASSPAIQMSKTQRGIIRKIKSETRNSPKNSKLLRNYIASMSPDSKRLLDEVILNNKNKLDKKMRKKINNKTLNLSNRNLYPDLGLKRYIDYNLRPFTFAELGEGTPVYVSRKLQTNRSEQDYVEPDFMYRRLPILKDDNNLIGNQGSFDKPLDFLLDQIIGYTDKTALGFNKRTDPVDMLSPGVALDPLNIVDPGFDEPMDTETSNTTPTEKADDNEIKRLDQGVDTLKSYNKHNKKDIASLAKKLHDSLDDSTYSLARAFPTYQILFRHPVHSDWYGMVYRDYYDADTVSSIEIIKSRNRASDVAVIKIVDLLEGLTERVVHVLDDEGRIASRKLSKKDDNMFKEFILRPGIDVQIRMGYANKTKALPIVFTGIVTEMSYDTNIVLVAQGFGYELLAPKNVDKSSTMNSKWAEDKNILADLLDSKEVAHFGKETFKSRSQKWRNSNDDLNSYAPDLVTTNGRNIKDGFFKGLWKSWSRQGQSDIDIIRRVNETGWETLKRRGEGFADWMKFAVTPRKVIMMYFKYVDKLYPDRYPETDKIIGMNDQIKNLRLRKNKWNALTDHIEDNNLFFDYRGDAAKYKGHTKKFYTKNTTIWNIAKELELRHPGFVAMVVPFDERATLFFGRPEQPYWWTTDLDYLDDYQDYLTGVAQNDVDISKKDPRLKPFAGYFFAHSSLNIISNTITPSAEGTYNMVSVSSYAQGNVRKDGRKTSYRERSEGSTDTLQRGKTYYEKLNDNIPEYLLRYQHYEEINAADKTLAKKYAFGHLAQNLRDMYKGELVMLGDGSIKPYDTIYLYDEYNDIVGPVEVEQVVHSYTIEHGFTSTITPDLCLNIDNPFKFTFLHALSSKTNIAAAKVERDREASDASKYKEMEKSEYTTKHSKGIYLAGREDLEETLGTYRKGTVLLSMVGGVADTVSKFNPAGILTGNSIMMKVAGKVYSSLANKIYNRNPINIHPLIHKGSAYVAGIDGFEQNSIFEHYSDKITRTKDNLVAWKEKLNDNYDAQESGLDNETIDKYNKLAVNASKLLDSSYGRNKGNLTLMGIEKVTNLIQNKRTQPKDYSETTGRDLFGRAGDYATETLDFIQGISNWFDRKK